MFCFIASALKRIAHYRSSYLSVCANHMLDHVMLLRAFKVPKGFVGFVLPVRSHSVPRWSFLEIQKNIHAIIVIQRPISLAHHSNLDISSVLSCLVPLLTQNYMYQTFSVVSDTVLCLVRLLVWFIQPNTYQALLKL
jgi:hypothetical protein